MKAPEALFLNGVRFELRWVQNHHRGLNEADFTPNELATLRFCGEWLSGAGSFAVRTSGTTGAPKTIHLSRHQMTRSAHLTAGALGLLQGQRALVCLAPSYIAGKMMLVRGLELGLELNITEPAANPLLASDNGDPHYDFTALVPMQLRAILSDDSGSRSILSAMQSVLVGGGALSRRLCREVDELQCRVFQTFGMTETASHIALRRLNGPQPQDSYETLPGVKIGQDDRGCLTIESDLCVDATLVTNDRVQLVNEHAFLWLGRADWVINTGGVKVHPEQVEATIREAWAELQADVAEVPCVVVPAPDARLGQRVVAVFETPEPSPSFWPELRRRLSRKLQAYEIPRDVFVTSSLERTQTGKIDRKSAAARYCKGER